MILISNDQDKIACSPEMIGFCTDVVQETLSMLEATQGKQVEVSVALVDHATMQVLNRQYRGKDMPTDVLSFAQLEGEDLLDEYAALVLGDIVINMERAQEQALEYDHTLQQEIAFLLVHGLLHLVGYDHDQEFVGEMREKQEEILRSLQLLPEDDG